MTLACFSAPSHKPVTAPAHANAQAASREPGISSWLQVSEFLL